MITIKEIAAKAGVHRSTVDKVLHHRPGVSTEVRQRVQKIIDESGYRPNPLGLALKKKHKKTVIGVLLLHVDALEEILSGLESAREEFIGYELEMEYQIREFIDITGQAEAIQGFIDKSLDAIILMATENDTISDVIQNAKHAQIPVVTVNLDAPQSARNCFVGEDGARAGRIAGRLMGEFLNGIGDILVIANHFDEQNDRSERRSTGFLSVLQEDYPQIQVVKRIESHENLHTIYEQTYAALQQFPSICGILITSSGVSEVGRVLRAWNSLHPIRVICFERYPEILQLLEERVITCTLDSHLREQGKRACSLIMEHLIYGTPFPEKVYLDTQILVKQ